MDKLHGTISSPEGDEWWLRDGKLSEYFYYLVKDKNRSPHRIWQLLDGARQATSGRFPAITIRSVMKKTVEVRGEKYEPEAEKPEVEKEKPIKTRKTRPPPMAPTWPVNNPPRKEKSASGDGVEKKRRGRPPNPEKEKKEEEPRERKKGGRPRTKPLILETPGPVPVLSEQSPDPAPQPPLPSSGGGASTGFSRFVPAQKPIQVKPGVEIQPIPRVERLTTGDAIEETRAAIEYFDEAVGRYVMNRLPVPEYRRLARRGLLRFQMEGKPRPDFYPPIE